MSDASMFGTMSLKSQAATKQIPRATSNRTWHLPAEGVRVGGRYSLTAQISLAASMKSAHGLSVYVDAISA